MSVNPYYYGLVKQIGPWKTTARDLMNGQYYKYTPNEQTEDPYTMAAGNGSVYAQYSSQGLIYDATTTPTIVSGGKLKSGKVVKAKQIMLVGAGGVPVLNPNTYAMEKYMEYNRQAIAAGIKSNSFGTVPEPIITNTALGSSTTASTPSPMYKPAGDSPTGDLLAEAIKDLQVDPEVMRGVEETIVSRPAQDVTMSIPGVTVDEPYGDIEPSTTFEEFFDVNKPIVYANLTPQEQADLDLIGQGLIDEGYSQDEIAKMLNVDVSSVYK